MTEIKRISIDKLYGKEQLIGYELHLDNGFEVEDVRLKSRITFTYQQGLDAIIAYTECLDDQNIEDQPAYDSTIIPIEMLKLLGSCMLNAEQIMESISKDEEHKTEESTSDT